MEGKVVNLPGMTIVGFRIETNLKEFESGIGKITYQKLLARENEIPFRRHSNVILLQQYPEKSDFDPRVDRYVQFICFEVSKVDHIPPDMTYHQVPDATYVTITHQGLEKNMQVSYDYLYGKWMKETGSTSLGYDFEIWDERYKPDSPENEIDIFVAVK